MILEARFNTGQYVPFQYVDRIRLSECGSSVSRGEFLSIRLRPARADAWYLKNRYEIPTTHTHFSRSCTYYSLTRRWENSHFKCVYSHIRCEWSPCWKLGKVISGGEAYPCCWRRKIIPRLSHCFYGNAILYWSYCSIQMYLILLLYKYQPFSSR